MFRRAVPLAIVSLGFLLNAAFAQDAPPTADQVKDALAKFQAERADALKTFKAEELASADELAGKAEKALAAENTQAALRLAGEARWQVPFVQAGLPAKVSRVLGAVRMRHGDRVNALTYSPDGTLLASASRDGTVRLWNVGNGREVLAYRGHENTQSLRDEKETGDPMRVPSVAFSQDGLWVASCGGGEIHVWETKTGKKLHTLKGHKKDVVGVAFAKNKNLLASAGDDKKLILWDVAAEKADFTSDDQNLRLSAVTFSGTDKAVGTVNGAGDLMVFALDAMGKNPKLSLSTGISDGGPSNALAFTRDGAGIFTAGKDGKIKLTAGPDGMPGFGAASVVRKFEGHSKGINSIALSKDGATLVSGSEDQTVIVWDANTGKLDRAFQGHIQPVTSVAIRPDGKQVASGSEDGSIRLWPLNKADEHRAFTDAKDNLWAVAYGGDGKTVAAAGADRIVRVYDTATGKLSKELPGHKGAVTSLAYLGNDKIVSGAGDKLLKIWDIASGTAKDCEEHGSAVLAVAATDKLIVSGGADRFARGWAPDGKALWSWASKSAVCAVAIRKDGKKIALGCADGTLVILATDGDKEPKPIASAVAHTGGISCVAFHPEADRLVTSGGDGTVKIFNLFEAGNPVEATKFEPSIKSSIGGGNPPVTTVAYSNDGKFLVSGGAEGVVRIWDVTTNAEVRSLRGHTGWVTSAAFGPDGRSVVSCAVDKTVRLFELAKQDAAAAGHSATARCIAVSRDGKYAATGSDDRTVKVWNLSNGREVATLTGFGGNVTAIVFVGNDKIVAGSGSDIKLRTFTFAPVKEVQTLTPGGQPFFLASSEDGKSIGAVWAGSGAKDSGFDIFAAGAAAPTTTKGGEIAAAVLSPDAEWGVTGSKDGVIRIWGLAKKDRLGADWPILKNSVADIGVTTDKKSVVVIDSEGEVKVGDVAKREVTGTVKAVTGGVNGLVVSPTSDKFATLAATGEVRVFDMTGKEIAKWQLPFAANGAAFTVDGKKLLTANADGTAFVLDVE